MLLRIRSLFDWICSFENMNFVILSYNRIYGFIGIKTALKRSILIAIFKAIIMIYQVSKFYIESLVQKLAFRCF